MLRQHRGYMGFTLIEMLLVIVIIGVLAGAIITSLSGRSQQARIARAESDIRGNLSLALDLFESDVGRYPTAEEGLEALMEDPGAPGWQGPYLQGELRPDPWGTPYEYRRHPEYPERYQLSSAGPDLQPGTEDDVTQ